MGVGRVETEGRGFGEEEYRGDCGLGGIDCHQ